MIFLEDPDFTLYQGDALEVLRTLPAESVHMCVTSPPFYGLRDYAVEGQIGLEATPDEWVARLVDVFREVRRALRSDGSLWVEIGDAYGPGKQLLMMPARLGLALQADGWIMRCDNIWARPNPMPESVRDRPTKSHSYVFLLSKSPRYFFDQEAVREEATKTGTPGHLKSGNGNRHPNHRGLAGNVVGKPRTESPESGNRLDRLPGLSVPQEAGETQRKRDFEQAGRQVGHHGVIIPEGGRNIRSVWTIPTEPLPDEHYAAFPQRLVERCILAGTSEQGCCPECGAPWERIVERSLDGLADAPGSNPKNLGGKGDPRIGGGSARQKWLDEHPAQTTGWRPGCDCGQLDWHSEPLAPVPCTVLDPFLGSGTTALVARRHGRRTIGIELSPAYCAMAARRLSQLSLLADGFGEAQPAEIPEAAVSVPGKNERHVDHRKQGFNKRWKAKQ